MNILSSTLLWCGLQTTLLALLTLVLGSRPWRIGGASAPLFGLIGVALITLFAFVPISWSWTFAVSDRPTVAAPTDSEAMKMDMDMAGERLRSLPDTGGERLMAKEDVVTGSTYMRAFMDGLRNSTELSSPRWAQAQPRVSAIVLGLFGIGMTLGIVRLMLGLIATQRLIRTCRPIHDEQLLAAMAELQAKLRLKAPVLICQTDKLSTAATIGAWRPRILLPNHWREWTAPELNAVLAHELAHIAHGDFAAILISQLGIVFHFYHPLVHWLSGRLRLEQELAADSVAARLAGGQEKYVRVLAKLALEHQDRFVGWPARAFLPTRQTFLRRLEMLRDGKLNSTSRVQLGRWFAMAAIGMALVVLVGLKPPPNRAMAQDSSAKAVTQGLPNRGPYDVRFISDEGILWAARPAELLANNQLSGIAKQIQELPQIAMMIAPLGVELTDIEQVIFGFESLEKPPTSAYARSSKPIGKLSAFSGGSPSTLAGADIFQSSSRDMCLWKPDDRSLVLGSKRNVERFIQGRQAERKLTETELWKKLMDRPFVMLADGRLARKWPREMKLEQSPVALLVPSFSPILEETEVFGLAVSIEKEWSLAAMTKSTDSKGAAIIQETSQAGVVLIKNGLRELSKSLTSQPNSPVQPPEMRNAMGVLLSAGIKLAEAAKIQTEGGIVSLTTSIKGEEIPVASIANALWSARRGADRMQSVNNLKQIALAFHNFHDSYRQFPHSTKSPNPANKHPVSWRVMILPFIEQAALYQEYRFDEPWDGPNNVKLLAKMPALYRHPNSAPGSKETNYVILTGEEAFCQPSKVSKFADIQDGTSNTIMAVEAKTLIPWTKPDDIEYASDKPLPSLGGFSEEGFNAAFADGSVRFISKSMKESELRAYITARGREVITP